MSMRIGALVRLRGTDAVGVVVGRGRRGLLVEMLDGYFMEDADLEWEPLELAVVADAGG